jgi:hypothetical protein
MNCKPGDLAMVVRSVANNNGKIVRCVRIEGEYSFFGPAPTFTSIAWFVEPAIPAHDGTLTHCVPDAKLRPIRDPGDDAQDESFRWAPAPEKVLA